MSSSGVYMYPYNHQVTLGNFNMPFSSSKLTVHRGANNPLSFTVHNADGKYMVLADNEYLTFSVYDARQQTKVFESVLEKQIPSWVSESGAARPTVKNKEKVYYGTVMPAGAIEDLSPGSMYRWSIRKITQNGDLYEPVEYLYTGLNYEASAVLEINTNAAPMFVGSTELSKAQRTSYTEANAQYREDITVDYLGSDYSVQVSSPVRCATQYGAVDGLSTIAFYFNNFSGRIKLQGTLSNNIPIDSDAQQWFDIKLGNEGSYISPSKDEVLNGIYAWNFTGNYMYLRVQMLIEPEYREVGVENVVRIPDPFVTVPKILIRS